MPPLLLFVLLAAACGGGGGGDNSGGSTSDTTRPSVQIQGAPNSHDGRTAFTLGIRFSESVSGFVRSDISVTGAAVTAFSGSGASYTATLTPNTPPVNIAIRVPANVARDSADNGNLEASQTVNYSGGEPSAAARISGRLTFDRVPFARSGSGLNAGSTGHRSHEVCPRSLSELTCQKGEWVSCRRQSNRFFD